MYKNAHQLLYPPGALQHSVSLKQLAAHFDGGGIIVRDVVGDPGPVEVLVLACLGSGRGV